MDASGCLAMRDEIASLKASKRTLLQRGIIARPHQLNVLKAGGLLKGTGRVQKTYVRRI